MGTHYFRVSQTPYYWHFGLDNLLWRAILSIIGFYQRLLSPH